MIPQLIKSAREQACKFRASLNHPYWDRFKPNFIRSRWDRHKIIGNESFLKQVFYLGWTRPTEHDKASSLSEFYWPFYENARYNRELTKFMFSFRSEDSISRNINNLMFITGPEKAGKSWLLQHNLLKFQNANLGTQPVLLHLDLAERNSISFAGFLDAFDWLVIDTLVSRSGGLSHLLSSQLILDTVLFSNDKVYTELGLHKVVTSGLLDISTEQQEKILELVGLRVTCNLGTRTNPTTRAL